MDFFQDFPLCCQENETVEAIFRAPTEDSDREGVSRTKKIMESRWRPPQYRDTSLRVAPLNAKEDNQSTKLSKTLSVGFVSCDDSISPRAISNEEGSLPPDFVPPKSPISRSSEVDVLTKPNAPKKHRRELSVSSSKSQFSVDSSSSMRLESMDVVCGRGAPTSIHPGNLAFKKTIKKHEMTYLCSTRSEKPKIAMKLLEEFRSQGVRFVKRERNEDDRFEWVEIGEQRSYEKICQALREGAPKLRRQMMATEAKKSKITKQNSQERQDCDTGSHSETKRVVCDVSHVDTSSSSSKVKTSNEQCHQQCYDPIGEQNHCNIEWLYYQEYPEHKSHNHYLVRRHCDVPYYVHLPPHLGGERLFRDRIE